MQYWRPGGEYFTGDCMPWFHDGVFHLIYLVDQEHHQALGGQGGHQWAHVTSSDLVHWQHHPLLLPITEDYERSMCTGSVFYHEGKFHAFYATRLPDWRQVLSRAVSTDGIHFTKLQPNPFATPPANYSPLHFRDPNVIADPDGNGFHMIVTAYREDLPIARHGGCLTRLTSPDLQSWTQQEPLLYPGFDDPPECPDLFFWKGWWYLLFSNHLLTRYRMARHPLGPWLRPAADTFDGSLARVMKTAPFTGDRRIGVAWIGTRTGDRDDGKPQWGGNLLFRELVQHADGALHARFPAEMTPATGDSLPFTVRNATHGASADAGQVTLAASGGLEAAGCGAFPQDVRIRLRVIPAGGYGSFGLRLRSATDFATGYDLTFWLAERMVTLHNETIYNVDGLGQPCDVEIVATGDIIDVCVDNRRCIVNRLPELHGDWLYLFAHNAEVTFTNICIEPLAGDAPLLKDAHLFNQVA